MLRSNGAAARAMVALRPSAATDVTGFGLAGHLVDLARKSGVGAQLELASLPVLPGALELLARGVRSTFHAENARLRADLGRLAAGPRGEILFDPQTSGGLLFGVPPERAASALVELRETGARDAAIVGRTVAPIAGAPLLAVV
jgi:selenide,water dikinase